MKPENAIQVIDQATSRAMLTREEHSVVVQAIQVLAELVRSNKSSDLLEEGPQA